MTLPVPPEVSAEQIAAILGQELRQLINFCASLSRFSQMPFPAIDTAEQKTALWAASE
jgi:hypothetical protein